MPFDKKLYRNEFERLLDIKLGTKFFIRKSDSSFKIKSFINKSLDSFKLAKYIKDSNLKAKTYWTITISYYSMLYIAKAVILAKGYETDDHYATQIALGHLMVPSDIEIEDFEILDQTHKMFEQDYIDYFEDARKESSTSRYSPTKLYAERRVEEVYANTQKFIAKLIAILGEKY